MDTLPAMTHPGPAGVHPGMAPPALVPSPQPIVNEEIFVVIVSKHSPSCNQIFESVRFIAPHLNTRILEIDHPEIRKKVLDSGKIKTVPCIVLLYPTQQRMQFFEGVDALRLIQQLVQQIQQKTLALAGHSQNVQALRPPPPATPIEQVISPMTAPVRQQMHPQAPVPQGPSPADPFMDRGIPGPMDPQMLQNPAATVMDRNINPPMPMQIPGHEVDPSGRPPMGASTVPGAPRAATEPLLDGIPGGTMIDDGGLDYDFEVQPATGMTMDQIFSPNDGGIVNREKEKKSKAVHSKMDQMMRERDELDRAMVDPRLPNGRR